MIELPQFTNYLTVCTKFNVYTILHRVFSPNTNPGNCLNVYGNDDVLLADFGYGCQFEWRPAT